MRLFAVLALAGILAAQDNNEEAKRKYRVGLAALEDGDLNAAAENFERASRLAPQNALIRYNLAIVQSKRGENLPAKSNLEAAIALGLEEKTKDEAETLLAKIVYRLEKSSGLARDIAQAWTGRADWHSSFEDGFRWEYRADRARVDGCTVTVDTTYQEFELGGLFRDKWRITKSTTDTIRIPMAKLTKVDSYASNSGFERVNVVSGQRPAIEVTEDGVPKVERSKTIVCGNQCTRILDLMRSLAKSCNASLE